MATLHVGVILAPPVQLLDLAAVDLFAMLDPEYLRICSIPEPIASLGPTVKIDYIVPASPPDAKPDAAAAPPTHATTTAQASILATATTASAAVAPGQLDVLLIPGPDPTAPPPPDDVLAFVRAHMDGEAAVARGTDVLSVCTGVYVAGYAGILDGRVATGPRPLLGELRAKFPKAKEFVDKRWVQDGRFWCGAGITNGNDMMSAYLRHRFPEPLANVVCVIADVGDRGQDYDQTKVGFFSYFIWQVLRAVLGLGGKGKKD